MNARFWKDNDEKKVVNDPSSLYAYVSAVLGDGELSRSVHGFLSGVFNRNGNAYDSAIDSVYNETGIGGSATHHIVDGNHSMYGAWESASGAYGDDSLFEEVLGAFEHLLRDFTTQSGVNPFFSVGSQTLDGLKDVAGWFGVSRSWVNDILTVNALEGVAGIIAGVAAFAGLKRQDMRLLGAVAGSSSVSAAASANPITALVAFFVAYAALRKVKGGNKKTFKKEALRGGVVTGTGIMVSSMVGGHAVIGVAAGLYAAHAVNRKLRGKKLDDPVSSYLGRTLKKAAGQGARLAVRHSGIAERIRKFGYGG